MSDAPCTTQLYCRLSRAATGSSKKVSLLEGESGLKPARKTYPTRYKPDRACLAAFLAEVARGTEKKPSLLRVYLNKAYALRTPRRLL